MRCHLKQRPHLEGEGGQALGCAGAIDLPWSRIVGGGPRIPSAAHTQRPIECAHDLRRGAVDAELLVEELPQLAHRRGVLEVERFVVVGCEAPFAKDEVLSRQSVGRPRVTRLVARTPMQIAPFEVDTGSRRPIEVPMMVNHDGASARGLKGVDEGGHVVIVWRDE